MKIYVDENKTMGNEIVFLEMRAWTDFKTKEHKGVRIDVVLVENSYEKTNVRIAKEHLTKEMKELKEGDKIKFTDLDTSLYVSQNGKFQSVEVSFKATGVEKQ